MRGGAGLYPGFVADGRRHPLRSSVGRRCVETESCNSISKVPVSQCVQNRRCRRLSLPAGGGYSQKLADALAGHNNWEAVHEFAVRE